MGRRKANIKKNDVIVIKNSKEPIVVKEAEKSTQISNGPFRYYPIGSKVRVVKLLPDFKANVKIGDIGVYVGTGGNVDIPHWVKFGGLRVSMADEEIEPVNESASEVE